MGAPRKRVPAEPSLLTELEQEARAAARLDTAHRHFVRHCESRRICWPEWEGPTVGGLCEVANCIAQKEDGSSLYAYMEQCRLIERRPDGTWLAVIEMGEVWGKPWSKDGTRLVLEETDIWPPTKRLWEARRANGAGA